MKTAPMAGNPAKGTQSWASTSKRNKLTTRGMQALFAVNSIKLHLTALESHVQVHCIPLHVHAASLPRREGGVNLQIGRNKTSVNG